MVSQLPRKLASKLTPAEMEIWEKPWVHNFRPLDLDSGPQDELKLALQLEKQGAIFRHVRDALARCNKNSRGLSISVNDGLFGLYSLKEGAAHVDHFDVGGHIPNHEDWHLDQTRIAAKLLGLEAKVKTEKRDLFSIDGHYDFCICMGVLTHFEDPQAVLAHLRDIVKGPLEIYALTSVPPVAKPKKPGPDASREADTGPKFTFYKQMPAEGRPWGSRFSHDSLIAMAVDAGWTVVNEKFAELPYNWFDRGSTSLFCI